MRTPDMLIVSNLSVGGENAASDPLVNDGVTSLVQRLKRIGRNNARLHEIREQRKATGTSSTRWTTRARTS
ncbi:hypothetical protein PsorP6_019357 [Peronosclerospora sorghi]|nr:hypothetical protein PsorP6_019357 [Peronosclerospora sorghi]